MLSLSNVDWDQMRRGLLALIMFVVYFGTNIGVMYAISKLVTKIKVNRKKKEQKRKEQEEQAKEEYTFFFGECEDIKYYE